VLVTAYHQMMYRYFAIGLRAACYMATLIDRHRVCGCVCVSAVCPL